MKRTFLTEIDFAKKIVEYFRSKNFDVYQEVKVDSIGIADIVAVSNDDAATITVIECKLQMNLDVLYQADRWIRYANYVYVAVPKYRMNRYKEGFSNKVLLQNGIGYLTNKSEYSYDTYEYRDMIREVIKPVFNRRSFTRTIRSNLFESQKNYCLAGSKDGTYTPFKDYCNKLSKVVCDNPGITLKDALSIITKCHYSSIYSAMNSTMNYISRGIIKDIIVKKGKLYRR